MRSMPPASWHLAERPVPAPPPTMGSPRATMALNLSMRADRSKRGMVLSSHRHPGAAWACKAQAGPGPYPCTFHLLFVGQMGATAARIRSDATHEVELALRCMGPGLVPLARCASERDQDDVASV